MKKTKLPKIKRNKLSSKQKKMLPIIAGVVVVLGIAGLTMKNMHQSKVDAAYQLADQILGTSEVQKGSPYIAAEYPVFEQNFKEMADKRHFGTAMITLVDEFTAVSLNNAQYYDAQQKETSQQNVDDGKGGKDKKKAEEQKEALQLMQDSKGRDHNFEKTAAALSRAVGILNKMDYINGDLYNSFSNFYNTYSTYILEKYSSVPDKEKDARYKYEFATQIRSIVKKLDEFNNNAGEFYRLGDNIVCTPAQVASLYDQAIQISVNTKDGATLARTLKDMKSFPYTKDRVPIIDGEILRIYGEGAKELATLQNGVGGYYDDPNHRAELATMNNIPFDEKGIHGDFYYLHDGHSYVAYRGKSLVEQQIDKPIRNRMEYALRMPEGGFIFVGKDKIQLSSDPEVPFVEGDFSGVVQQLAALYAEGGLPEPIPVPVKTEPKKEPASTEAKKKEQIYHDARSVQAENKKYRGEVVGKLDAPQ